MIRSLRHVFLAALVLLPLAVSAQTARTVLIERFTGTWCQWCPYGEDVVNNMLLTYPNLREIAFHSGDPLEVPEGAAIDGHLMVTSYPSAAIDRILWYDGSNYTFWLGRNLWPAAVSVRDTTPSPMSISVSGYYHEPTRVLTINVSLNIVQDMSGEYYLNVVLAESGINEPQKKYDQTLGQVITLNPYYHTRVLRKMIDGAFPPALTTTGWTAGQTINTTKTYTLPANWDETKIQLAAYVTKKVMLQVGQQQQPFNMAVQQTYAAPLHIALRFVPVELVSFHAKQSGRHIELNWMTATENSNRGWYVERREENGSWQDVGFVDGYGTTTEKQSYSFLDEKVLSNTMYDYRLRQIDYDGTTEFSAISRVRFALAPSATKLHPNYPNPFNPSTNITVDMETESSMRLDVFDALGRLVKTLADGTYGSGSHLFSWDGTDLNNLPVMSGIYFCRMTTPTRTFTQQMQLSK